MFDYCAMNSLTRSMLWTMRLLSMTQIVYVAYEHVRLYNSIQSDGIIMVLHMNARLQRQEEDEFIWLHI